MKISFERVTALEYRLKAAQAKIRAFESGEKYVQMEKKFKALLREKERIIQELTAELARSHTENISIRNQWFDVFEEMEKEYDRKFKALMRRNEQLEKRALKAERKLDEANNKITLQRRRMYELETAWEDEKGKNLKLRAQLNRDYENSSIPSSKSICRK